MKQNHAVEIYLSINQSAQSISGEFLLKIYVPLNFDTKQLCKLLRVCSRHLGINFIFFRGTLMEYQ